MRSKSILFIVFLIIASIAVFGCSDDKSTSVTNPVSYALQPTGTIQGRLVDRVTLDPIQNAVVNIGIASASTNADGQFVLSNVPATCAQDIDGNGGCYGSYEVSINMKSVSSPVNMGDAAATPRYADYYFTWVNVYYSSLNDSEGGNPGGGSGTNHDTPVYGLVASAPFEVGKLSTSIQAIVAGCSGADFYTPVGAGYTVTLRSHGSDNNASGDSINVVDVQTTDSNGMATFATVEADMCFDVEAASSDGTMFGENTSVCTQGDGETTILSIQESTAVHVCLVDNHGPEVVSITPAVGTDQTPATGTTVEIGFSEPIAQSALTTTDQTSVDNLYDNIEVTYAGTKAGNIAYTLAWNAAFDQLTVTFETAASGLYYVRMIDMLGLEDAAGNGAELGDCPDDSAVPGAYGIAANGGANDCTVYFSTNGGAAASAVTDLTIVNAANINNTGTPVLDWSAISGAKEYNVYRRARQIWGSTVNNHSYELVGTGAGSGYTSGALNFVENSEIALEYDFVVRAVNSDGVEAADSNVVTAADALGPQLINGATFVIADDDGDGNCDTMTIDTDEPLDEAVAEGTASYVYALGTTQGASLTATGAVYYVGSGNIVLTFPDTAACADWVDDVDDSETLTVNGLQDVAGNTIRTTANVWHEDTNLID